MNQKDALKVIDTALRHVNGLVKLKDDLQSLRRQLAEGAPERDGKELNAREFVSRRGADGAAV